MIHFNYSTLSPAVAIDASFYSSGIKNKQERRKISREIIYREHSIAPMDMEIIPVDNSTILIDMEIYPVDNPGNFMDKEIIVISLEINFLV